MMEKQWNHKIFDLQKTDFDALALEIFRHQSEENLVYKNYIEALGVNIRSVNTIEQIPFLPIRFFKSHVVTTGNFNPLAVFESSGTTGSINSRHFLKELSLYEESFIRSFQQLYGNIENYVVIGLLPSYLERNNSSLVYMVNKMIQISGKPESGFYLNEFEKLAVTLQKLEEKNQKVLLIGVTFGLLDFAEQFPTSLSNTIVVETGGMKGRREEMIRAEVHTLLKSSFGLDVIHSEYGMTELLSQAWSTGGGVFQCPSWMRILVRDEEDPLTIKNGEDLHCDSLNGAINIIDLANVHSCSFIASDDAGKLYGDGRFEVMGRIDNSDLRGCSLMYQP